MKAFINQFTAAVSLLLGVGFPMACFSQGTPVNTNDFNLEQKIRAVVSPQGGVVFAVANYESAAVAKALEIRRQTQKEANKKTEAGEWEPEIIRFNTPEELYSSAREVRKLPGFQTLAIYMKCGTKFSASAGTCTGTGTNASKIVYFDRWLCKAGGQNDSCWTQTLKIGETRFYNSENECATNATPRKIEPIWDSNFCSASSN